MTPWVRCAFTFRAGGHGLCRCGLPEGHRELEHVCPHGYGQEIVGPGVETP